MNTRASKGTVAADAPSPFSPAPLPRRPLRGRRRARSIRVVPAPGSLEPLEGPLAQAGCRATRVPPSGPGPGAEPFPPGAGSPSGPAAGSGLLLATATPYLILAIWARDSLTTEDGRGWNPTLSRKRGELPSAGLLAQVRKERMAEATAAPDWLVLTTAYS